MIITLDIPVRLLTSERARREAFTPVAVKLAVRHGNVDSNTVLDAMEAGWQFAVAGADAAESVAASRG